MTEPVVMPLGPVMLDVAGTELTDEDRRRLRHPLTGGVILFTRNFESAEQLGRLTASIHALRTPGLLIAVDHEGGRVQRFRKGFTQVPPMREFGRVWDHSPQQARHLARDAGLVLAAELRAYGVDFTFAPVLDVDFGRSGVIGDRSFHRNSQAIVELGRAVMHGLHDGGMSSVGKHFPGHGYVEADSHLAVPIDQRSYEAIAETDLVPFGRLVADGLQAIMPAHVIYPQVHDLPAGFSTVWLKEILRERLGFDGVIFSDDLSMEGASVMGGPLERARAALAAGCDMVLVCNAPEAADEVLRGLGHGASPVSLARLARMHGRAQPPDAVALREDPRYVRAVHALGGIGQSSGDLPLA